MPWKYSLFVATELAVPNRNSGLRNILMRLNGCVRMKVSTFSVLATVSCLLLHCVIYWMNIEYLFSLVFRGSISTPARADSCCALRPGH